MITIDQLLESVDLDFEPRFVTKDEDGCITIWDKHKPALNNSVWNTPDYWNNYCLGSLKLSEFANKPWTECIYEVPRKTTGGIEKVEGYTTDKILAKVNELVDAVNKHADIIQQIGQWGSSKGECLWCETLTKPLNR